MVTEMNTLVGYGKRSELSLYRKKAKNLEDVNNILVHNLRGMASNIKMLVEMLMSTYVHKNDNGMAGSFTLEEGLSYIGQSSTSLLSTLGNLMKGIAPATEKVIAPEECDIEEIVTNISHQQNGFILEKNATIKLDLRVKTVVYNRVYLESTLYNLISNALKYARPGMPVEITVTACRAGKSTIISVKDNGLGIDLEKNGDKLFQLGNTFHEGYDSKGMGLYITRKQIESLGGNIRVKSKVNEGSEFIVTL